MGLLEELEENFLNELRHGRVVGEGMLDFTHIINHKVNGILRKITSQVVVPNYLETLEGNPDIIITAEVSGIGLATILMCCLQGLDAMFAKKGLEEPLIMSGKNVTYREVDSATKGGKINLYLCKDYLEEFNKPLLVDDFIRNGTTLYSLIDMCREIGVEPIGALVFCSKSYDSGRGYVRKRGVQVESIFNVDKVSEGNIHIDEIFFRPADINLELKHYSLKQE